MVNNAQKARSLITNGMSLFSQKEAQKHFTFNQALLAVDLEKYGEAANQYKDVYLNHGITIKVRPSA